MVKQLFVSLYNWLLPSKCLLCSNIDIFTNGIFCTDCFAKVTIIEEPICNKCGKLFTIGMPINALCTECESNKTSKLFNQARALFLYDNVTQKIVLSIKKNANDKVANACSRLLFYKYIELFNNIDFIVPVPSHWLRTLYRGFNPADIIAKELSIVSGIKVNRSLRRIRYTAYQHKKSKSERLKNLNNAFSCNNMSLCNKNVLLVDDVFSTGATLNECTKELLNNGVKLVNCLTIASTAADYYNIRKTSV
ncbi:MAG: ComF family protein [Alphaproteobacteria bacterium]|nr:ComF family protein [Alphaproteobacteria bacterium]